jgi:hypothetical protein
MRRLVLAVSALLALGACAAGDGAPPTASGTPELQVGFPSGGLADTIAITAVDRLPLRAAELVAPDSAPVPANWIDVNARPRAATGQWVAGNPNAEVNAALRSQVQVLATVSQAEIPLPDPVAYRRDWANYRIRLTFGMSPKEIETREIAAPEPPPLPAAPPPTPMPPPG